MTAVITTVIAFFITWISGFVLIPLLHKMKFGQTILDIGPSWHKKKQGIPTMAGIMFIVGIFVSLAVAVAIILMGKDSALKAEMKNNSAMTRLVSGLFLALGMGLIGFIDDYIKVVKKRNLGLNPRQKTIMQLLLSAGYLCSLMLGGMQTTWLPFIGNIDIKNGVGLLFWPIALLFIYGFTNAVNLTDGVDGLASAVTFVVAVFFMIVSANMGELPYGLTNIVSSALAGAMVGFLMWNLHPARCFMGDTGSMFLGGLVVALSFMIERPAILLIAGVVYLLEALSVVLQVAVYKRTKKRIFKMTPIHHHFEMSGYSENKIVLLFSSVGILAAAVAYFLIMYNFM